MADGTYGVYKEVVGFLIYALPPLGRQIVKRSVTSRIDATEANNSKTIDEIFNKEYTAAIPEDRLAEVISRLAGVEENLKAMRGKEGKPLSAKALLEARAVFYESDEVLVLARMSSNEARLQNSYESGLDAAADAKRKSRKKEHDAKLERLSQCAAERGSASMPRSMAAAAHKSSDCSRPAKDARGKAKLPTESIVPRKGEVKAARAKLEAANFRAEQVCKQIPGLVLDKVIKVVIAILRDRKDGKPGGQFRDPQEISRAIDRCIDPKVAAKAKKSLSPEQGEDAIKSLIDCIIAIACNS